MEKHRYIIGIDPDVEKSGMACLDMETRQVEVCAIVFPELLQSLLRYVDEDVAIVIEDSDMSVNWHYGSADKPGIIAAKGRSVGMCHATTRHIREICDYLGFDVYMQRPLRKMWKGPDGKITQEEIMQFIPGLPKKMNQECRDAALLAWNEAGLPIRIPASFYAKKDD